MDRRISDRLSSLLAAAPIGVFLVDAAGVATHVLGRTQLLGQDFSRKTQKIEFFSPKVEAPEWLTLAVQQALTGTSVQLDRDFQGVSYHVELSPAGDAASKSASAIGVVWETSAGARAERDREVSSSLLRATIESTTDGILVVDRQGKIILYNEKFAKMWRIPEEILSLHEDEAAVTWVLEQLLESETFLAKVQEVYDHPEAESFDILRFKDGRYYERYSLPQRLGDQVIGRVWGFRDVTERHYTEAQRDALLAEEQSSRAGVSLLAEASRRLAARMTEEDALFEVVELALAQLGDWCLVDEQTADGSIRRRVVTRGEDYPDAEPSLTVSYTPSGEDDLIVHLLESGELLCIEDNPDPKGLGIGEGSEAFLSRYPLRSALLVPLSARGKSFGALTFVSATNPNHFGIREQQLAENLATRIATALDNGRLYRAAEDAIQLRDEFLSIASHELYTPLTSLFLAVQSTQKKSAAEIVSQEQIRKLLTTADKQIRRLTELIGSLLDVSRIEAGKMELDCSAFCLDQLIDEVSERFATNLERAGCSLEVSVEPNLQGVWDRSRLEQVLTNILSNAIKFGAGKPVKIEARSLGGNVRLSISDGGLGIDPVHHQSIFARFERAVSARHFGGLGLGLYICKQIVDAHGGTITVASAPGSGATFIIELPRGVDERKGVAYGVG